jgi:hypothetical protein
MYQGKHRATEVVSVALTALAAVTLLVCAPQPDRVVLFGSQTPRPPVSAPLGDTMYPVDDMVESVGYIGVVTSVATGWLSEGYVPYDGDPIFEPDEVTSHREGCYILIGDTSIVACLDGFVAES